MAGRSIASGGLAESQSSVRINKIGDTEGRRGKAAEPPPQTPQRLAHSPIASAASFNGGLIGQEARSNSPAAADR